MAEKPKLWVDNNILNYWCKAGCMSRLLGTLPYQLCTTELVQHEAEQGGELLAEATQAMQTGAIYVHPLSEPPLDTSVIELPEVHRTDRSLASCAQGLGGTVLTHDKKLIKYCKKQGVPVMGFEDFLNLAEQQKWLDLWQVENLRRLAGLI